MDAGGARTHVFWCFYPKIGPIETRPHNMGPAPHILGNLPIIRGLNPIIWGLVPPNLRKIFEISGLQNESINVSQMVSMVFLGESRCVRDVFEGYISLK